jgi:hypothetical protein
MRRALLGATLTIVTAAGLLVPAIEAQATGVCGTTTTTSITVTADETCAGSGISAGADNIVIDLGGHTLTGPSTAGTIGISTNGHSHVTVRHGQVSQFATGVAVSGSHDIIEGVVSTNNANGVVVVGSHHTVVGNFIGGRGEGVESNAAATSLLRNVIFGTTTGVLLDPGACCKVEGNLVTRSATGFHGVSPGLIFTHNMAYRNTDVGFDLRTPPAVVSNNEAVDNDGDGFLVRSTHRLVFSHNVANSNGFAGGGSDGIGLGFDFLDFNRPRAKANIAVMNDNPDNCAPSTVCRFHRPSLPLEAPPPCGSVIGHSMEFNASIACPGSDGYTIGKNGVIVDLGGHQVGGDGVGFATAGHHRVTIRNGEIAGFATAVDVTGSHNTIEGIVADGKQLGITVAGKSNTAIADIASGDGIGFNASGTKGSTRFIQDVADLSLKSGFFTTLDAGAALFDDDLASGYPSVTNAVGAAFDLRGKRSTISHSVSYNTVRDGFELNLRSAEQITSSLAFANGDDGFRIIGSHSGLVLKNNVADFNGFENLIDDNVGRGFEIDETRPVKAKANIASMNDDPSECSAQITC